MAYQDASYHSGNYTMIYLRFAEGTGALPTVDDISDGYNFVTVMDATYAPDATSCWFNVTNHATISCATHDWAPFAVACSSLTGDGTLTATADANAQYGWFWCGGVCPYTEVTRFNADITCVATDKSPICIVNDGSQISIGGFTAGDGTCNVIGFSMETAA